MKKAIRDHLRDFVAIVFLVVIALGVGGYILSNQRFYAPAWVPIFGEDFYELEAELSTAQAVVPGQGQTVNIAGVKVGDIGEVRLVDGRAVVEMKIQPKYADVYEDATILLRPKTGLKDMFLELDPGTPAAGKLEEGARIGVGNTLPDVNPDEILANLDRDTRDYLKVLLNSGAEALDGDTPAQLRETFKRFEPTSRDGKLITAKLAERRRNISRVIHNLSLLSAELGAGDRQLGELVQSANANFEAIGNQDARLREALRLFPGALDETRTALARVDGFTTELGPALEKLRPGARALGPSLRRHPAVPARHHPGDRVTAAAVRARRAPRGARHAAGRGGPGGGHAPPRRHLRRPERAARHPRLQPAGLGGGLPLLGFVAQPPERPDLHAAGRARTDPARPRADLVRLPEHPERRRPAEQPAAERSRDVHQLPQRIRDLPQQPPAPAHGPRPHRRRAPPRTTRSPLPSRCEPPTAEPATAGEVIP